MRRIFAIFVGFFCGIYVYCQEYDTLRVMSYNLENFYYYDSQNPNSDKDFTPQGAMRWTKARMSEKAKKIARVIVAANGWKYPDIVGFEEIGGPEATRALMNITKLGELGYKSICYSTNDHRGMGVAMIYNENAVKFIESDKINVSTKGNDTRDILFAKFKFRYDTIFVLVNHWPSKYGNAEEKEIFRNHVAGCARHFCDSIFAINSRAKIILMGDFNDVSEAKVLRETLGADGKYLINLSENCEKDSYKYQGEWETIDHVIVSPNCLENGEAKFRVCDLDFLLEQDERYTGMKPYRTYIWHTYHGGYSDHLPVISEIPFK